jgi:hypothetical protein
VVLTVWCAEIANSDPGRLVPMVDGIDELRRGLDEPITEPPETGPATRATDPLGGSTTEPGAPSPETVTTPAPNAQPPPASAPVTSGPVMPRVERGVMPAVVCLTLSEAEQQLARAGEYSPVALDLSGGADADEPDPLSIVVTQSPRAGAAIADGAVRLGVLAPGRPAGC